MMPRLSFGRVVCRSRLMLSCLRIDRSEMALSGEFIVEEKNA
ncbi:hypothetical protein [Burkholderia sp. BCC0397]|nr:hypothetical protein [Burkholderia sp. BCC0397]